MRVSAVSLFLVAILPLAACSGDSSPTDAAIDAPRPDSASDATTDIGTPDAHCATDADGDGHRSTDCGGDDCDDADANRYPGNAEVCDGANHDEDCVASTFGFRDSDGDGFPDVTCCNADGATMRCGTDCDDANTNVHPSQTESCNHVDDNCDGMIDEGAMVSYYADCDGDGHGAGAPLVQCTVPTVAPACGGGVWSAVGGDCDDTDAMATPGRAEVCDRIRDEDCNPATVGPDGDGDGFAPSICCDLQSDGTRLCGTDCDDTRASTRPGASEVCNHADDDCDGSIDDGLTSCTNAEAGFVACKGTTVCDLSTSVCCVHGATGTCVSTPAACSDPSGSSVAYSCDGPEDCSGGDVCLNLDPSASFACRPAYMYAVVACHYDVQCPLPQTCLPTFGVPGGTCGTGP